MSGETQNNIWPLPKFYFSVTGLGGNAPVPFQEVTGLETETKAVDYRHGNSPAYAPVKMPGLAKVGNATLRKGIFPAQQALWNWFDQIKMNTIARTTVVVSLLDETGAPTMVWTLNNAFPTKITSTDLKSDGNEVAVESIELAYETLVISTGS